MSGVYEASPVKRGRRKNAEIRAIKDGLLRIARNVFPCTLRGLFYQAVAAKLVEKTESAYDAVGRYVLQLRRDGEMPYHWIVDNNRSRYCPKTYGSAREMLEAQQQMYRRSLWADQPRMVEVWCEKNALIGVLWPVARSAGVPLLPCAGYPSETFMHESAAEITEYDKPVVILYAGDYDPSGLHISEHIEATLRQMAPSVDLEFQRLCVNKWQIEEWNLPTRPPKASDSRRAKFDDDVCVEVDAIPPFNLRELFRDGIDDVMDQEILARTKAVEAAELDTLAMFVKRFEGE